jgi:general secretion pathway protein C
MSLDTLFKRSFPLIVGAMIASSAYLQASGMSSLVSREWTSSAELPPEAPAPSTVEPDDHVTSAAAILARNPFDSATGALDVSPVTLVAPPPIAPVFGEDPYEDPLCESGRVVLIVESDDPTWSFASIVSTGKRGELHRTGDEIGGATIDAIARDRVWLTTDTTRCQLRLGDKPAKPPPRPGARPAAAKPGKGPPADIAARIQKISDTEFTVDRSAVEMIMERQAELMGRTRLIPVKEGSKTAGFRFQRIPKDSLLGTLGLRNGDEVRTLNGYELGDPQRALEAYARLRNTDRLALVVRRGGKDMTIDFNIR